jgi:thioredoxin 1
VAGKVGDRARIIKIDVDKNPAVARKYRVVSVPTLMIFKNGEIKLRESGVMRAPQLVSLLERNM